MSQVQVGHWEHKGVTAQHRAQRQALKMHIEGFVVEVSPGLSGHPTGNPSPSYKTHVDEQILTCGPTLRL